MLIRNLQDFKNIIDENSNNIKSDNYILLHSNRMTWRNELLSALEGVIENKHIHIGLLVKIDNQRLDTLILTCRRDEINDEFLNQISNYVNDIGGECILNFLERKWLEDDTKYAMNLMFTTSLNSQYDDYTLISYTAVAPTYRKNGLMKRISLNLIERLKEEFGPEHSIKSFAIHPATYLFFNPRDKEFNHFHPQELQELSCKLLLKSHGRIVEEKNVEKPKTFYYITPEGFKALMKYGILKTEAKIENNYNFIPSTSYP